mmetsp:Transcript_6298/g.15336  ORF Transcript_6298/g.15336 Transcript_6298/m.15336 type:complete len:137 (-) Transcript_6298:416-826(-)|eukprot:CAMPEP_0174899154 /NCGR_PEP_ID=MMETSP0167-20121228/25711_1 /TAXON_ID=38298 /ORGANISM="Rhodella maculata, Strain CCMP736" /LENGTH=136 /DNA_ID=CAMNT_0016140033 /DNA_START=149 /DNA_END=559 /DNA_ORIENTATION=-
MTCIAVTLAASFLLASVFALPLMNWKVPNEECHCQLTDNKCTVVVFEGDYLKCKLEYCKSWVCVEYGSTHACEIEKVYKDVLVPANGDVVNAYYPFKCEYEKINAYVLTPRYKKDGSRDGSRDGTKDGSEDGSPQD